MSFKPGDRVIFVPSAEIIELNVKQGTSSRFFYAWATVIGPGSSEGRTLVKYDISTVPMEPRTECLVHEDVYNSPLYKALQED